MTLRWTLLGLWLCVLGVLPFQVWAAPADQPANPALAALRQQLGAGFACQADDRQHLILAMTVDDATLTAVRARLAEYADAQRAFFTHPISHDVTVVVRSPSGDSPVSVYQPDRHAISTYSVGRLLTHEFTHALHGADQEALGQHHPIWIIEGLATFFETARVADGKVVPAAGYRMVRLKDLATAGRLIGWGDLLAMDQAAFMKDLRTTYMHAYGIMAYLSDRGLLKPWYDAYTAGFKDDPTGRAALEKTCGKPLAQIESDWAAWIRATPAPAAVLTPQTAFLGCRFNEVADGLSLIEVSGGMKQADLRPGDVVVALDARRIADRDDLAETLNQYHAGDQVKVQYRRDGRYVSAEVSLSRRP